MVHDFLRAGCTDEAGTLVGAVFDLAPFEDGDGVGWDIFPAVKAGNATPGMCEHLRDVTPSLDFEAKGASSREVPTFARLELDVVDGDLFD